MVAFVLMEDSGKRRRRIKGVVSGILMFLAASVYFDVLALNIGMLVYWHFHNKDYREKLKWNEASFSISLLAVRLLSYILDFDFFILERQTYFSSPYYLKKIFWYISWPLALLVGIGLIVYIARVLVGKIGVLPRSLKVQKDVSEVEFGVVRQWLIIFFPFVFLTLCFLSFNPKHFLLISPLFVFLAAFGWKHFFSRKAVLLLILLAIPYTYPVWFATAHVVGRELKTQVDTVRETNLYLPVYTTLNSELLSYYFRIPIRMLTEDAFNGAIIINAKSNSLTTFYESARSERVMSRLPERKLLWTYTDTYSHFPYHPYGSVYHIYMIPTYFLDEDPKDVEFFSPFAR
ncbi:MAG: hypothetical protein ACOX6V_05005 [Patescibacteria group bacterium]